MTEPTAPMSTLPLKTPAPTTQKNRLRFLQAQPKPTSLDLMVDEISAASTRKARIFLYGVGREGLMLKALCTRLDHLGLSAHSVFDMTTPPIASTGPGSFPTVDAICWVARSNGARVLLTAQPGVGHVPAQTMADDQDGGGVGLGGSRQLLPMGSLYEGALFVLFEMVVFRLEEVLDESPEAVRSRHTNLE
ncbi:uncharacterized protein LOC130760297 [Actinidia eriantha]|uniref:uncharacterized protein LOC130760297 n=1 Tax=Actinidia eriantha TaxID=165200 RepID=UPI002583BAF1|nr:uncharacterized protein LOC130760297 [Actinidia eriantha]